MDGKKAHFLDLYNNIGVILISILSFLIIHFYTRHGGIGISPDSIVYISAARNLLAHFGFSDYNNSPIVEFPLFYPFFLSVSMFVSRIDVVQLGAILNGILFAALILLANRFLKYTQLQSMHKNLLLLLMAISPALLDVYGMLWSETLFLVLLLVFFNILQRYLQAPSLKLLMLTAVPVAFACITRYAGVTLIGAGMYLIFFHPKLDVKVKVKHLLAFAIATSSLLVCNLVRNAHVTGLPAGPRERGIVSFQENFSFFSFTISDWLPVFSVSNVVTNVVGILISVAFVLILIDNTSKRWRYGSVLHVCSTFIVIYSVFIIGISTITHFEQLNNRFLSPIYVPLLIGLFLGLNAWLKKLQINRSACALLGLILISGFVYNEINISRQMFDEAVNYGVPGYSSDSWKFSRTSLFVKTKKNVFNPAFPIYSNAREAVYFLSGFKAKELAHKVDVKKAQKFLNEKVNYLIWYYGTDDNDLLDSTTIIRKRQVLKEYKFDDGSIFLLKAR
jgi:hypothetical protein